MRTRVFIVILLAFIPMAASGAAAAGIYRWTDAQGVIHFTDSPETIPPEYRSAEEKPASSGAPTAATGSAPAATEPEKTRAAQAESGGAKEDNATAPETSPPAEEATRAPGLTLDNFGHDESYWRDRKQFWEQRLSDAQGLYRDTRREFNRVNKRFDKREYRQMKTLRDRMRAIEKEIAEAQGMLEGGLAREARQAGAPPGWIR